METKPEIKVPERRYTPPAIEMVPEIKDPGEPKPSKPGLLAKIWLWFDGKKRGIGIAVQAIGMGGVGLVQLGKVAAAWSPIFWAVALLGELVGGVGVLHAIGKASTKYGETGKFGKEEFIQLLKGIFEMIMKLLKGGK